MELTLGFSPCPNDTFIFDALVHERIDFEGISFRPVLGDVEELNRWAKAGRLDITKLSYHAFGHLTDQYRMLNAGSALGRGVGPLLVAPKELSPEQLKTARIAIPGAWTTANFLLGLAHPEARDKTEVLFSEIEDAVVAGKYDAGLIIHENRFTYQDKGLIKLQDLGEFWELQTGLPIPLGGIAVARRIPAEVQIKIDQLLRQSVAHAFANPSDSADYVRAHAQAMDPAVMQAHIDLYVTDFSLDLGEEGRNAVRLLLERGRDLGVIPRGEGDWIVRKSSS
ncbi:MAG: 1,4-dihydroxy-6-naphthoate synthase [Bacteroidota bacterium]